MNRRMRNRTSGGVGGRRARARLLPDYVHVALKKKVPFFLCARKDTPTPETAHRSSRMVLS